MSAIKVAGLRVSLPLAGMLMMPVRSVFLQAYLQIKLVLDFTDLLVDVIDEKIDAVIRAVDDVSLIAAQKGPQAAIAEGNYTALPTLISSARKALKAILTREAADARRSAILAGLSSLGYEVREGMSTAWAKKGRVILRKPSLADYGAEISSAADVERLQARAVAFDAQRDTSSDRDVETMWCGDFGKLQGLLATQGGSIEIERALAVGAVPLKAVDRPFEVPREGTMPVNRRV